MKAMTMKSMLLAGLAAFALAGCGDKSDAPSTPSSDAAARTASASPLEREYRLRDAEPVDIDALFDLMPAAARPTYESAEFDERLGATVVTGLNFPGAGRNVAGIAVGRAEFYGLDLDAVERVKTGEAALDAAFATIVEKVRLFDMRPESGADDAKTVIGAVEIDRLRIREGAGGELAGPSKGGAARFFNAFDLAGLYFKDIRVEDMDNDDAAVSFSTPDLRLVGFGGGKLEALIAKEIDFSVARSDAAQAAMAQGLGGPAGAILSSPLKGFVAPDAQRVAVKSLEWRGVDMSGLLDYGLRGEEPPLTARNLIDLGAMKALDMESFIGGRRAARAAESAISEMTFTWLFPSKIRSESKGLEYDFTAYLPPEEEEAIAVLKNHGLDTVKGSGDFRWDWDADGGDAGFASNFETDGLADMFFGLDFAGLRLEDVHAALKNGTPNAVMAEGAFGGLRFTLADEKLLDAVYDVAALQTGQSAADMRVSTPAMVRLSGAAAAAFNPRIAGYVEAVAKFLETGGTLEVVAAPESPVSFADLDAASRAAPETLPDLVNLTVTHSE